MANETLKAGFDKYMAGVEAKLAKNPERANLEPNRLYTPLDLSLIHIYSQRAGRRTAGGW